MDHQPFLLDLFLIIFPQAVHVVILEKLQAPQRRFGAGDHQGLVAPRMILDKGRLAAMGTGDVGWPTAAGTDALLLDDRPHAGRAGIAKRTLAAAAGAEKHVTVDQLAAMDACCL